MKVNNRLNSLGHLNSKKEKGVASWQAHSSTENKNTYTFKLSRGNRRMNDENTNQSSRPSSLLLACSLGHLFFSKDKSNPDLMISPSERLDLEDLSGFHHMDWMKIFKEQRLKSKQFMCTIRDGTTGEVVGFLGGRYRPRDGDGSRVSIDFLERSYLSEKSKGYILVLGVLFAYCLAAAYDAERVKIHNPIEHLIEYYQNQMPGSEVKHRGNHSFIMASLSDSTIKDELRDLGI